MVENENVCSKTRIHAIPLFGMRVKYFPDFFFAFLQVLIEYASYKEQEKNRFNFDLLNCVTKLTVSFFWIPCRWYLRFTSGEN